MDHSPKVVSLGDIARRLDKSIHRVDYVIRSREILPALVVGGRRFYNEAAVQRIAGEIQRIEAEKARPRHDG